MKGNEKGAEGKADKAPKEAKPRKKKPVEKSREWEKDRREKLNVAFDILSKLLPDSDPTVMMSKIEILTKAAEYIKRLQEQNEEIIKRGNKTENEADRLKKRVAVLLLKTKELVAALRSAGVPLPSTKKRKGAKKTRNGLNELNKENKTEGKKPEKSKIEGTSAAAIVPNAGIVVQAPVVKPFIGGLQPINIDKKVLSRLGPGALILADGRIVNVPPIVPQFVVKPQPTVFVMQRVKKGESPIAPKKRDVTKLTFANKAPIPAIKTFRMESRPRSPKPKKKAKLKNDKDTPSTSTDATQKPQEKTPNVKYTIDSLFNKPKDKDNLDSSPIQKTVATSSFITNDLINIAQEKSSNEKEKLTTQDKNSPTSGFSVNSDLIIQEKPKENITQDKTPITSSFMNSANSDVIQTSTPITFTENSDFTQKSIPTTSSFIYNSTTNLPTSKSVCDSTQNDLIPTSSFTTMNSEPINRITQDKPISSSFMNSGLTQNKPSNYNMDIINNPITQEKSTILPSISTMNSDLINNHITQDISTPSSSFVSPVTKIQEKQITPISSSFMSSDLINNRITQVQSTSYMSTMNSGVMNQINHDKSSSFMSQDKTISTPSYMSTLNPGQINHITQEKASSFMSSIDSRETQKPISSSSYSINSGLIGNVDKSISVPITSSFMSSELMNSRETQKPISTPSSSYSMNSGLIGNIDKSISASITSSFMSSELMDSRETQKPISTPSSSYSMNSGLIGNFIDKSISTPITSSFMSPNLINNHVTQDKSISALSSSYVAINQDKTPISTTLSYTSSVSDLIHRNQNKSISTQISSFMSPDLITNRITQDKSITSRSYMNSELINNPLNKSITTPSFMSPISTEINNRITQDKSNPSYMSVSSEINRQSKSITTPSSSYMSSLNTDLIGNRIPQDKQFMNSDLVNLPTQEKSTPSSFMNPDIMSGHKSSITSSFMSSVNSDNRITQNKSTPLSSSNILNDSLASKMVSTITTSNAFFSGNSDLIMPTQDKVPITSSYMSSDLMNLPTQKTPSFMSTVNSDLINSTTEEYNKNEKKDKDRRYSNDVYDLHQPLGQSSNQMFPLITSSGPTFSHDYQQDILKNQFQTPQYQNNQIMSQNNQRLYQALVLPENQQFPNQNCDFSRYNLIPNNNFRSTNSTQTPTYKNNQNCDFSMSNIYQNNCDYRSKYKNCDNFSMSNITYSDDKAKEKLYSTNTEGNSFKTDCSDLLRISKEIEKIPIDNSDFSNDLFSSLQVPSGGHSESISPTAAFLLAFPLVSTSKNADNNETENNENQTSTPTTILQIGNIETPANEMFQPIEFSKDLNAEYLDVNMKCKGKKPAKKYQNYYPEFCDWEKKNKKQEKTKFYECYKNKKTKKITVPWMSETENYREENCEVDNIELYNKKGLGFSWSPSKALMPIDSTLMIPTSTLPTLTGDLALGTPDFKKKTPEKDEKRKSQQFLSVSQLVDPKSKKLKTSERQYKKPEKKRSLNFPKRKDQECMLNENLVPNFNWDKRYKGNYSAESLIAQDETFNYQQNNYFQNTEFVHEGQSQYQSFNFGQNHFSTFVPDEYQTDNFSLNNVSARPIHEKRAEPPRNQEGVQNNFLQSYYPSTTSQSNFISVTTPSSFGITTNTTTSLTNFNLSTIFPEMNDQRSAPTTHHMNTFNQYRSHPV